MFFVFLDTLVGIYSAKKRKIKVTSKKLSNIVPKITIYTILLILTYSLDMLILSEFIEDFISVAYPSTKAVALIIISIEAFSVDESIRAFNNDKGMKFYTQRLVKSLKKIKSDYVDIREK